MSLKDYQNIRPFWQATPIHCNTHLVFRSSSNPVYLNRTMRTNRGVELLIDCYEKDLRTAMMLEAQRSSQWVLLGSVNSQRDVLACSSCLWSTVFLSMWCEYLNSLVTSKTINYTQYRSRPYMDYIPTAKYYLLPSNS